MVVLHSHQAAPPFGVFDFNASQDGGFGWFLLTWHPEQDHVLEEIQTQIKLDIRNAQLETVSQLEIETWLKNFFAEYHWKLHALFRRTSLREKGISLLLAVLYDHDIYYVQFGRLLCGIVDEDYIRPEGRNWENFHVSSLDEMSLLGLSESDIRVKPGRITLAAKQLFAALPSTLADRLMKQNVDHATIATLLPALAESTHGCYLVLEAKSKPAIKRHRRFKRHQFSALIILLLTLAAVSYLLFGNQWLECTGRKIKQLLTSKIRLQVEQIPNELNIQSHSLRSGFEKIVQYANQPARQIRLIQEWQTDIEFMVTAAPSFDLKNIYVVSEDKLMAYTKSSKQLVWNKSLPANIRDVAVVRDNLIVFLDNRQMLCLKDNSEVEWVKESPERFAAGGLPAPQEIGSGNDPRLMGSILVVPAENTLSVYDVNSGKLLGQTKFDKRIQYLSHYDEFDNCFYAVVADGIHCIGLDIM